MKAGACAGNFRIVRDPPATAALGRCHFYDYMVRARCRTRAPTHFWGLTRSSLEPQVPTRTLQRCFVRDHRLLNCIYQRCKKSRAFNHLARAGSVIGPPPMHNRISPLHTVVEGASTKVLNGVRVRCPRPIDQLSDAALVSARSCSDLGAATTVCLVLMHESYGRYLPGSGGSSVTRKQGALHPNSPVQCCKSLPGLSTGGFVPHKEIGPIASSMSLTQPASRPPRARSCLRLYWKIQIGTFLVL